jgi:hypothetical protein
MAASNENQKTSASGSAVAPPLYGMPMPFMFIGPDNERTFQYEESLPPLPVPPLNQTLEKYLDSGEFHLLHQSTLA